MGEESHDNSNPQTDKKTEEVKQFTQTEVNEMISKRVNEINASKQKAIDDAVAKEVKKLQDKQRIASLEGEERLKAEYQQKLDEIEAQRKAQAEQLATAQRDLAISKAQASLASLDLPPDFAENLIGKDDAETEKNIQAFNSKVNELVAKKVNESIARNTPRVGTNGVTAPSWQEGIDRAFAKQY